MPAPLPDLLHPIPLRRIDVEQTRLGRRQLDEVVNRIEDAFHERSASGFR